MDQDVPHDFARQLHQASQDPFTEGAEARRLLRAASEEIDRLNGRVAEAENKGFSLPSHMFQPKEGGMRRSVTLNAATCSGWDLVLFIDEEKPTDTSGWMLELGVNPDGSICGAITARPGHDASWIFSCNQHQLSISDETGNTGEHQLGLTDDEVMAMTPIDDTPPDHPASFIIAPEQLSGFLSAL